MKYQQVKPLLDRLCDLAILFHASSELRTKMFEALDEHIPHLDQGCFERGCPMDDEPQPHKLSREVCGICWSQYDEGGKCGCKPPTDDVADSLALIVRNAIKYLKELEAEANSLRQKNTELDRKLAELEESNVMGAQSRLRTLNDEIIADLWYKNGTYHHHFARAIERWLKGEKSHRG